MLGGFAVCLCGKAEHQGWRAWRRRLAYIMASRRSRIRHSDIGWGAAFPEHPHDPLSLPTPHFLVSTTSQQGHVRNQLGSNLFIRWEPLGSRHFLKALHLTTKPVPELLGNASYPHHSTFLLLGRMDREMLSLIWASPVSQFSLVHTAVVEMNAFISPRKIKSKLIFKSPPSVLNDPEWSPLVHPFLEPFIFTTYQPQCTLLQASTAASLSTKRQSVRKLPRKSHCPSKLSIIAPKFKSFLFSVPCCLPFVSSTHCVLAPTHWSDLNLEPTFAVRSSKTCAVIVNCFISFLECSPDCHSLSYLCLFIFYSFCENVVKWCQEPHLVLFVTILSM